MVGEPSGFVRMQVHGMKVLITGMSGLLGLNAALSCRDRHQVVGAVHSHPVSLQGVTARRLDIRDPAVVRAWVADERPDLILHTAGLTNVEACESDPAAARALNVQAAEYVADAATATRTPLLHVSTDHLFDGHRAMSVETDAPSPLNEYARTKLEAERVVAQVCPQAWILRTNFYGWGHRHRASFSDWIVTALRAGQNLTMFDDVYFTPILVNDLVDAAFALAGTSTPGLYHLCGGERISKYAFGRLVAEAFGLDASRIAPVSVDSFPFKAARPRDMSLDCSKAGAVLGRNMPSVADGLARLADLEKAGYPRLLDAAFEVSTGS